VTNLKKGGKRLTVVGEETINERKAVIIRAEKDKRPPVDWCFDVTTALVLKWKTRDVLPGNKEGDVLENYFSDYREIEGGRVPMRIQLSKGGERGLDITILEVKFFTKLDDTIFAKP
jgi:hypothetical protein